ncbi:hypothetical protein P152DRAFT_517529 [Eremomyces bilateralis CBS 781.70]|uniref:Uncharacterized protein n=1 Tax=Eremomyces bilateralis CBS 781.70 TaxID=1392243 RepID=A0A6G1FS43_9PEZI|nr:uncharacterized protein P152DRAFT_517529 [Eremomyces bilateralis CBS 781.70]KAF1808511.1 hypothetical protein P152DRAFT_517529 [Eremomyces bilateralis CBS 781.70]
MAVLNLLSVFAVAFLVVFGNAVELEEIKPWDLYPLETRDLRRRDMNAFDLRSTETFLWGAQDGVDVILGNFTVMMPGDSENILSMERFHGMLKSVKCEPEKLTIAFEDDQTFEYAKRVWDWVNGADNHTFVMVASKGDCGDNKYRVPYKVYSLHYDEPGNIATLNVSTGSWKDLAHSYEIQVGNIGIPESTSQAVSKRDISKSTSIDLGVDFRFKGKAKIGPVFGEIQCNPCNTRGKLNFEFKIKQKYFVPVGAKFKASPKGLKIRAAVTLISGNDLKTKKETKAEDRIRLIKSSLPGGVSIPGGILSLGPHFVAELGWEFTAAELSIMAKTGATATISDKAVIEADLLNPSKNKFSGWVPKVEFDPLEFQARASVKFQAYVVPSVNLEASVLGKGVETGFLLKAPYIEVRADAITAPDGNACRKGDKKGFALKIVPSWGVELKFTAAVIKGKKLDISLAHGNFAWPGVDPKSLCYAFDEPPKKTRRFVPALPATTSALKGNA